MYKNLQSGCKANTLLLCSTNLLTTGFLRKEGQYFVLVLLQFMFLKSWVPQHCALFCQFGFTKKERPRYYLYRFFSWTFHRLSLRSFEGFLAQNIKNIKRDHLRNLLPFWELQVLWFSVLVDGSIIFEKCNDCSFQNYCQLVYAKLKNQFLVLIKWCKVQIFPIFLQMAVLLNRGVLLKIKLDILE